MGCFVVLLLSSPGACSRSAYAMACCLLSIRPSLAFHSFDISSRTISWIELKLSRRHCGVATWRFRIAKTVPFLYPRNSSNDFS